MNWINNNSILLTQRTLDLTWERQRLALDNIANVDTPGFKARFALFEDELRGRLERLNNRGDARRSEIRDAIMDTRVQIRRSEDESHRADGNNVNLDIEQLEVVRNALHYQFALRQISDQFARLRTAIEGR